MLTWGARIRRIILVIVVLAVLGFLLSKVDWGKSSRYSVDNCACAHYAPMAAVLPANPNGMSTDIATLDPARAQGDTSSMIVVSQLFDGLVTFDKDLNIEPWGAKSWTVSEDGQTYTFTLQPNQKFSDGVPVTASDYAWSLNRSIDPCLGESSSAVYWALIKDAAAFHAAGCADGDPIGDIPTLVGRSITPDDSANTLTVTLTRPAGYFLAGLAYPWAFVVEKGIVTGANLGQDGHWLEQLIARPPSQIDVLGHGGSGMFYVSKWDHHGSMTLMPNPHWWGLPFGKHPNFTDVTYTFVSAVGNRNAPFDTFNANPSLDFTTMLPDSPDAPVTSLARQSYYHAQPALGMIWLAFNQRQAPFNNLNARKAFCLAINREYLNQRVYHNTLIPSWHLIPQGMPGFDATLLGIDGALPTGDALRAQYYWQTYLAHKGHAPTLTLYAPYPNSDDGQLMATLRDLWQQTLGVSIRLDTTSNPPPAAPSSSVYVTPLGVGADYPDPQAFTSQAVAPGGQRVNVPGADELLLLADIGSDMSQRLPAYHQAEQLLVDNVAVCPLFQTVNYYAMRPWMRNFAEDARGLIPNDAWVSGYGRVIR